MAETVPINSNFHEVHYSDHYYRWLESKSGKYKEYRNKWVQNPVNFINEGYPINLDIEASSACNLRCPMCPRTVKIDKGSLKRDNRSSAHFDFDLYLRLIDEAAELGVYALKLNWLGEPLMNPRIVDMVRYAKEKGIEDVMLNTNGVLLDEDMSRDLITAGIDKLFFSFDAPDKETYEKIRVGAKYEDVLSNIIRFHEIRAELGSLNPITRVSMVVLPGSNIGMFEDLFRRYTDIVAYDDFVDHQKDRSSQKEEFRDTRFACAQLWQRMIIAADGAIAVCCHDHEASFKIGNIQDMTIKEAWNSQKYNELREYHRNLRWYDANLCSRCPSIDFNTSGSV